MQSGLPFAAVTVHAKDALPCVRLTSFQFQLPVFPWKTMDSSFLTNFFSSSAAGKSLE